jgi:hypothetical protein
LPLDGANSFGISRHFHCQILASPAQTLSTTDDVTAWVGMLAAGGCQYLAVKMAAKRSIVASSRKCKITAIQSQRISKWTPFIGISVPVLAFTQFTVMQRDDLTVLSLHHPTPHGEYEDQ